MPRIEVQRLARWLWVAWNEDDRGSRHCVRLGISADHARNRTLGAYWAPDL